MLLKLLEEEEKLQVYFWDLFHLLGLTLWEAISHQNV